MNRSLTLFAMSALVVLGSLASAQESKPSNDLVALNIAAAVNRPEPNAFIEEKAPTHEALLRHIKSNDVVMGRYMRHFGMTREQVLEFVGSLHLGRLDQDGVYLVYNTPESGEIRARSIFYKKGTSVWLDQMGNPVMKVSCGNPMMRGTDVQVVPQTALEAHVDVEPMPQPAVGDTSPVEPGPIEPLPLEANPLPSTPAALPGSVETLSRGGGGAAWLALIPLAALATHKSGGGGDTPVCNPRTNPNCVPEPITMVLMGVGAAGLVTKKLRAKKS